MAFSFLKVSPIILQSKSYSSACSSWYWKFIRDWRASTKLRCLITHETTISSMTSGWITSLGFQGKPNSLIRSKRPTWTIHIHKSSDAAFTNKVKNPEGNKDSLLDTGSKLRPSTSRNFPELDHDSWGQPNPGQVKVVSNRRHEHVRGICELPVLLYGERQWRRAWSKGWRYHPVGFHLPLAPAKRSKNQWKGIFSPLSNSPLIEEDTSVDTLQRLNINI